jgi:hypothetical protein
VRSEGVFLEAVPIVLSDACRRVRTRYAEDVTQLAQERVLIRAFRTTARRPARDEAIDACCRR